MQVQQLKDHFAEVWPLLERAAQEARSEQRPLYLVGGAVRDFLLGRPSRDLDMVVEGDGEVVARMVWVLWRGGVEAIHERFGTAGVEWEGWHLDLAMARSESYARPGALPTVRPGTLQDDLRRRDFSINALALMLSPSLGELVDPFGGRQDLDAGLVRVLHDRSFQDDPTRMLRALRYAGRLGFRLEDGTEALLRRDLAFLGRVSADRQRHELELVLQEAAPETALLLAQQRGVLAALQPTLRVETSLFEQARQSWLSPSPGHYLALLVYPLSLKECQETAGHFGFPSRETRIIQDTGRLKAALPGLPLSLASRLHRALAPFSPEATFACALGSDSPEVRSALRHYLEDLAPVKPMLRGEDLLRLGVSPGPKVGEILRRLLEARLDGAVRTREDEEGLVRRTLAGEEV